MGKHSRTTDTEHPTLSPDPDLPPDGGLSLVELLVAAAAAMVVLGSVLSVTIQHARQRRTNAELNLAYVAAMDTLERVRTVPFDQLPDLDGTGFDVADANGDPGGLRTIPGDADGLPGSLSVTPTFTYGSRILYRVTATVDWTGIQRRRQFELQQLIVDRK